VNLALLDRAAPLFDRDRAALAPLVRDGVLDLLGDAFTPTFTQRTLDTAATAWLYDRVRDALMPRFGLPDFASESRAVAERLALAPGAVVLDVACGHGNFSVDLAKRVGPNGLVVGLDIAGSMLRRAAARVRSQGLENVLLVRGDALALPFRPGVFDAVNCSGGLHQMPDLARALGEMARVAKPGAHFAASGFARSGAEESGLRGWLWRRFALHFIPVTVLATAIERAGFEDTRTQIEGSTFAYASARRPEAA
jgi:ubiquinone/menaquinone biosynthesis C-methylase UbiE